MYDLVIEIRSRIEAEGGTSWMRGQKRIFMGAIKSGLVLLHKKFVKGHFERSAYGKYHYTGRQKKGAGRPMYDHGDLYGKVTRPRSISDAMGSFKRGSTYFSSKLPVKYGRPKLFEGAAGEARIEKSIFIMMEEKNISYASARRKVFSQSGYGEKNTRAFQERLTATVRSERRTIAKHIMSEIYGNTKRAPGAVRRRVLR